MYRELCIGKQKRQGMTFSAKFELKVSFLNLRSHKSHQMLKYIEFIKSKSLQHNVKRIVQCTVKEVRDDL